MNMTGTIESAELQFKQILEEFFISVYDEKTLISHGIDHHRRVWNYAKELTLILADRGLISDTSLPTKLIIACYLHDIGMSVDPGIMHGHHSRDLCIRFLSKNHLTDNDNRDLLSAIGNHDKKDYSVNTRVNYLLNILSVADDLDAFGFTGIFRYSEIYLTRGISLSEIGHIIKKNADKRFDNFVKSFGFDELLVEKHKLRYEILVKFFNEYNNQVIFYKFGGKQPAGFCGVLEILPDLINNKKVLNDTCMETEKFKNDPAIRWFFEGLANELNKESKKF